MTPLPKTSNPAQRTLELFGVKYLEDLTKYTEKEILALHGMGPKAIRILKAEMAKQNLQFVRR
jgi:hypothetical protein